MLRVRLRQTLVIAVGLLLAAVMVLLGIWQLDVYHAQGAEQSARRAASPAVPVESVARAGAAIGDGYGRPVAFRGRYLPDTTLLVPVDGRPGVFRVLTALRLADGDVLPVVRGTTSTATTPEAPTGEQAATGLLLPSEEAPPGNLPPRQISSVRIPTLAQTWPGPLLSGFVSLSAADAAAQGLHPAAVDLPEASGRLRNGAYALQWWLFAAFAVGLAVKIARDQERLADPDEVPEVTPEEPVSST